MMFDIVARKDGKQTEFQCRECGTICETVDKKSQHKCRPNLTPDQLAYIRAAAARWRMDEAGPMMLESLRKAEFIIGWFTARYPHDVRIVDGMMILESVRDAIAAAE